MLPEKLVADIIKEQGLIIGEQLAMSRAENSGAVSFKTHRIDEVSLTQGNTPMTLEKLIQSYQEVFGQASVEVCLSVIKRYPKSEVLNFLPDSLKSSL